MKLKNFLLSLTFLSSLLNFISPLQRTNLFEPYEWLLDPVRFDCYEEFAGRDAYGIVCNALYEGAFSIHGYCGSAIMGVPYIPPKGRRKGNPLHIFTKTENSFASFLGYDPLNDARGALAQQYVIDEGVLSDGQMSLHGDLSLHQVKLSLEKWINDQFRIGWYVPLYKITLHKIAVETKTATPFFEYNLNNPFYKTLEHYDLFLKPYSMHGIGDSSLLLSWQNNFVEYRNTITSMVCSAHGGLHLPTRMHQESEHKTFLPIPLGYDTSFGIILGGALEAGIGRYVDLGIAADCTVLIGSLKERLIKTDVRQTELLLLAQEKTYLDPGMHQKFDVYISGHDLYKNKILTVAYQYNKQHDSDLIVCSDHFSTLVASSSQTLDPWSTHSATFIGTIINPFGLDNTIISGFLKYGLSGERSLVSSTAGFSLSLMF